MSFSRCFVKGISNAVDDTSFTKVGGRVQIDHNSAVNGAGFIWVSTVLFPAFPRLGWSIR